MPSHVFRVFSRCGANFSFAGKLRAAARPGSWWLTILALASSIGMTTRSTAAADIPTAQLIIVVDGLRPDHVTPDLMPRLAALGQRGIVFTDHHSVFPTVTRVNASSLVTGAYPETHGLPGNTAA